MRTGVGASSQQSYTNTLALLHSTGMASEERVALNLSLHVAAADGDYAVCERLLKEEGADAWWEDENTLNWSALHLAANGGFTKLVKLLLRRGALWNAGEGQEGRESMGERSNDNRYQSTSLA